MVEFFAQSYPWLKIKLPCREWVKFEAGRYNTEDEEVIRELRAHQWYKRYFMEATMVDWVKTVIDDKPTVLEEPKEKGRARSGVISSEPKSKVSVQNASVQNASVQKSGRSKLFAD